MRRAIFAGSFDPFTIGHADIVSRGLALFDEIIVAIGENISKSGSHTAEERRDAIARIYAGNERVRVITYNVLTADLARSLDAQFLLRGVRNTVDFEYERSMAEANHDLAGLETVLLTTRPELAHISSTLVRDLQKYNKDITKYLP